MSEQEQTADRNYPQNKIRLFILRIELGPDGDFSPEKHIPKLPKFYDRIEQRVINALTFNFGPDQQRMDKETATDLILVSEKSQTNVTFSKSQRFIAIETTRYTNYSCYAPILESIVQSFTETNTDLFSTRVGMRFINEFPCFKQSDIRKILNKPYAAVAINLLAKQATSRAIALIETNSEGQKSRIQFGVPNKYYPARIQTPDLSLDIDVSAEGKTPFTDWRTITRALNHSAYEHFLDAVSEDYRNSLR